MRGMFTAIVIVGLAVSGCHTVSPMQEMLHKARIPHVEFQDGDLADAIIFLVVKVNTGWQRPKESIGLIQALDPARVAEEAKYQRLRDVCGGKKITLRVDDCAPLDLLTFLTQYADVRYEFRGERIVIVLPGGEVLGTGKETANQASEAIGVEATPQPDH